MKKAMYNVEKNYAVVGVLEEMNKTLTVLEHYVPRFFKGALSTYWGKATFLLHVKVVSTFSTWMNQNPMSTFQRT